MTALELPVPSTTGTVTEESNFPESGKSGFKVTSGDAYKTYTFTSVIGRTYFFTLHGERRSAFSGLGRVFNLVDTAGETVCSLRVSSAGVLEMYDHEGVRQGSTIVLDEDKKFLIDVSIKQSGAGNGTVSVRVDKELIISGFSTKLTNTAWNRLRLGINTAGVTVTDGWVWRLVGVNDDQGSAPNNTWPVATVYPGSPAALAPSGLGRRPVIPVGITQVNNVQFRSGTDRYAMHLVLNQTGPVHQVLMGFNMEGVEKNGSGTAAPEEIKGEKYGGTGRDGYADGNGGKVKAQLCKVKEDGTPDLLSKPLAEESFNPVTRYEESKTLFGIPIKQKTQILFLNFGGVSLTRGVMHCVVISNVAEGEDKEEKEGKKPLKNFFSVNCPTVTKSAAGPHNERNLSKFTDGAIAGLDPRERCEWSVDSGSNWFVGEYVGGDKKSEGIDPERAVGHFTGYYNGTTVKAYEAVRIPWYGIRDKDGKVHGYQPYYNFLQQVIAPTLRMRKAARAVTLTEAGGLAPEEKEVGVVTVTNLTTGKSATTASLGSGLQRGVLSASIAVNAGDTILIAATGTVYLEKAESFVQLVFGLGGGDWPFTTDEHESDRAVLFTLPHPYFAELSTGRTYEEVDVEYASYAAIEAKSMSYKELLDA
jgi:hypothetical protein